MVSNNLTQDYFKVSIPKQLCAGYRFIRVYKPGDGMGGKIKLGKEPMDAGWQKTANYPYLDKAITKHIRAGGNYGVLPCGGYGIADIDDVPAAKEAGIFDFFGDTFTVKTGRGSGAHIYFYCNWDKCDKIHLQYQGKEIADIRVSTYDPKTKEIGITPFHVVGPGCLHASGRTYEIQNDRPIEAVKARNLQALIGEYAIPEPQVIQAEPKPAARIDTGMPSVVDYLGLKCTDYLMPDDPHQAADGQIEGAHPIHGSDTGTNLVIDQSKNLWYCRRCGTGGGPITALAVKYGIIDCSEARRGCLKGHKEEIDKVLIDEYGAKYEEFMKEEKEAYLKLKNSSFKDRKASALAMVGRR